MVMTRLSARSISRAVSTVSFDLDKVVATEGNRVTTAKGFVMNLNFLKAAGAFLLAWALMILLLNCYLFLTPVGILTKADVWDSVLISALVCFCPAGFVLALYLRK